MSVDGVFDHRRISIDRILAEATSWDVLADSRAEQIVQETLTGLELALEHVPAPAKVSEGMTEALEWNLSRLSAGSEISERKR